MKKYERPGILTLTGSDFQEILGPAETQYIFHVIDTTPPDQGVMNDPCSDILAVTDDHIDPSTLTADDICLEATTSSSVNAMTVGSSGGSAPSIPLKGGISTYRKAVESPGATCIPLNLMSVTTTSLTNDTMIIDPVSCLDPGDYSVTVVPTS